MHCGAGGQEGEGERRVSRHGGHALLAPGTASLHPLAHCCTQLQRVAESDDPAAATRDFIARQKMGRLGTAQEIASLVLYLASDESVGQYFTYALNNFSFQFLFVRFSGKNVAR